MRDIKLARLLSFSAPRLDELPVLVEFQNARIAVRAGRVTLPNENVAVAGDDHIVRFVEQLRGLIPLAPLAFGSQRQQDLSLWIKFHDGVCADVSRPDISVLIDPQAV